MNAWGVILRVVKALTKVIDGVEPEDFFFWIMFKIQVVIKPFLKNVYCIHGLYYSYFTMFCHYKKNIGCKNLIGGAGRGCGLPLELFGA